MVLAALCFAVIVFGGGFALHTARPGYYFFKPPQRPSWPTQLTAWRVLLGVAARLAFNFVVASLIL